MVIVGIKFLLFAFIINGIKSNFLDNSIKEDPVVSCQADSIKILSKTLLPFRGKIYVKGFSQEKECTQLGNGSSNLTFLVKFDNCGLKRSREVDGISFVTTIIFSFHSVFVTKVDRAFKVNCHYTETVAKVSQSLNIEDLKTEVIKEQYALPTCKYEILNAEKDGEPVKFARIGDQIFHRWSCTPENEKTNYCMLVHSCSVYDGQGGDHIPVLDSKGCGVDNYILKSLVYVGDLESVQTSNTFKFADKSTLNFNCQIGLLIKDSVFGCLKARPGCGGDDYKIVTASEVDNQLVTEPMSHYQTGLVDIGGDQYVEATDDKVTEYVVEVEPSTRNEPHYEDFATDDQVNYTDVVDTTVTTYTKAKMYSGNAKRNIITSKLFRKGLSRPRNPRMVAEFDLPEQSIIVLGIEDVQYTDLTKEGADSSKHHLGTPNDIQSQINSLGKPGNQCKSNDVMKACLVGTVLMTTLLMIALISLLIGRKRRAKASDISF